MKAVKTIVLIGCVLTLAGEAFGGDWSFSGRAGAVYVGTPGIGARSGHYSHHAKLMPPSWRPPHHHCMPWSVHPGVSIFYIGDDWGLNWYQWHSYYPGPAWPTPVYYRTRYVYAPSYSTAVSVIPGGIAGYEPVVVADSGVFASRAPVLAPVAPLQANDTAAWTTPDRPRRDLPGIGRILQMGGVARAEAALASLLKSNPSDAEVSYIYAYVLFLREKYATASFALRRGLMLDGSLAATGPSVLEGFHDAKRSEDALARLDRHIESHPDDSEARFLRGYVLFLGGRTDAARQDLDAVLKAKPADPDAGLLLKLVTPQK
jgi:hypothetical protein